MATSSPVKGVASRKHSSHRFLRTHSCRFDTNNVPVTRSVRVLRFLLVLSILTLSTQSIAGQTPASRPILFIHGFCGNAQGWNALRVSLSAKLNSESPGLYPDSTYYDVYFDGVNVNFRQEIAILGDGIGV